MQAGRVGRVVWRRAGAAGLAATVVALSVAASTASAATPLHGMLARWHRWSLAHTGGTPRFNFASVAFLDAGPREVLIAGTRYEMGVSAFDFLGSPPGTPFTSVDLVRTVRSTPGRPALQAHEYDFDPQSGATFTFNRKTLATAALDMGNSIAPSTLTANFTASGPARKRPCRLVTGGHGFQRHATGTMAYPAFGVVTSTSPFFGTLTTGPVRAQVDFDPGCAGAITVLHASARAAGFPERPCPGRESLDAQTQTEAWGFDKEYGARLSTQIVMTGTNPNSPSTNFDAHAILAETSIFSLPRATHTLHGATAKVFASGNPFMTGSATFTSTSAPGITRRHSCTAGRRTRHFITYKYAGRLTPGTAPMTANFDTAPLALTSRRATLTIRAYP
jgi:hypothetical protein